MTVFGAHIGLQDTSPHDVIALARHAEEAGFDWVSIWDHFLSSSPVGGGSLDSVSMHSAIAAATSRVRVGCLVYCVGYRHPAVLCKAIATIDQISGGRADLGLGAGWSAAEYRGYGIPFPSVGTRMDALDDAIRCARLLLRQSESTYSGEYFSLDQARCDPRPVQDAIPIWIGGAGERRTLRIAAELADGWNAPFLSAAEFGRKKGILEQHCADVGRKPSEIRCAANVGIGIGPELLEHHYTTMGDADHRTVDAVVTGRGQELVDQIGTWIDAGADQVNFTWRAPFDRDVVDTIATAIQALR